MNTVFKTAAIAAASVFMLTACSTDSEPSLHQESREEMSFDFRYPSATRVFNDAFENDDCIGVFVTRNGQPLQLGGNVVNNELFKFNGSSWTAERKVFWEDGTFDIYAYYPHLAKLNDVEELEFDLPVDQSTPKGLSSADFLWASKENVTSSSSPVPLQFSHRLSKVVVKLEKGEGFEGEIPSDCEVYIHSTATTALIDLTTGDTSRSLYSPTSTIKAYSKSSTEFEAIVVPQNLDSRRPLVEIVSQGVSYLMEGRISFRQGCSHSIVVSLSKNPEQVKIEIGGYINPWN